MTVELVQQFDLLPRTGKYVQAYRDACFFFDGILNKELGLGEVQIGQVEDSFFFEWGHTYVNILFECAPNTKNRVYVHYVHGLESEFTGLESIDAALSLTEFHLRK